MFSTINPFIKLLIYNLLQFKRSLLYAVFYCLCSIYMFGVAEDLEKQTEWITFYQVVWCCLRRSSAPTHGPGDSYQHHWLLNGIDGIVLLALRLDTHSSLCVQVGRCIWGWVLIWIDTHTTFRTISGYFLAGHWKSHEITRKFSPL